MRAVRAPRPPTPGRAAAGSAPRPAATIARGPCGRSDRGSMRRRYRAYRAATPMPAQRRSTAVRRTAAHRSPPATICYQDREPPQALPGRPPTPPMRPSPTQHGSTPQDGYQDYLRRGAAARGARGILAIAGVFALAVIGTAGAFGYRAMFGSSGSGAAAGDQGRTAPSKIVPAAAATRLQQADHDRVGDRGRARGWCRAKSSRSR